MVYIENYKHDMERSVINRIENSLYGIEDMPVPALIQSKYRPDVEGFELGVLLEGSSEMEKFIIKCSVTDENGSEVEWKGVYRQGGSIVLSAGEYVRPGARDTVKLSIQQDKPDAEPVSFEYTIDDGLKVIEYKLLLYRIQKAFVYGLIKSRYFEKVLGNSNENN